MNTLLIVFSFMFLGFYVTSYGQGQRHSKALYSNLRVSLGVNAVNNAGTRFPWRDGSDWAFNNCLSFGFEYAINDLFAVEELISFNKYIAGASIDGVILDKNYNYFSADTHLNFNVGSYFLETEKVDLIIIGGLGSNKIDVLNASANLGFGALFWFTESFGVRLQTVGKFAFDKKNSFLNSNHYYLVFHFLEFSFCLFGFLLPRTSFFWNLVFVFLDF